MDSSRRALSQSHWIARLLRWLQSHAVAASEKEGKVINRPTTERRQHFSDRFNLLRELFADAHGIVRPAFGYQVFDGLQTRMKSDGIVLHGTLYAPRQLCDRKGHGEGDASGGSSNSSGKSNLDDEEGAQAMDVDTIGVLVDRSGHHPRQSDLDALPAGPVVVIRTPYKRQNWGKAARIFAERGYYCLVQDCRGRFGSGGDFFPIAHEKRDGGETIRWVADQPWCNGKIAT